MEKFKTRNIWFVILIGAAIFAVFTNEIGFEKFIVLISNVNKPLILLAVFFNMLNLISLASVKEFDRLGRIVIQRFNDFLYFKNLV